MENNALKRALMEAMALVDEADLKGMRGRRPAKVEVEIEPAGAECEACKAGDCAEHLSEDDAEGMASLYAEG